MTGPLGIFVTGTFGVLLALAPAKRPPALQSLLEQMREAERHANNDPKNGAAALGDALEKLEEHAPELAADPEAREERLIVQLSFARALLFADDAEGARAAVDEAIRIARGEEPPSLSDTIGPRLAELYEERRAALSEMGRGAIELRCAVPCSVYLDEAAVDRNERDLLLGNYRLWVEAKEAGTAEPLRRTVTLAVPEEIVTVQFPEGAAVPSREAIAATGQAPAAASTEQDDRPELERRRMLPRWIEITGLVAGALAVGTGATLVAIDGNCTRADPCDDVFRTQEGGIAALAAGGALMIAAGILLTLDEVRIRKHRSRTGANLQGVWLRF